MKTSEKTNKWIESYERINICDRADMFNAWKKELYKLANICKGAEIRDGRDGWTCCPTIDFEADGFRAVCYLHSDTARPAMYLGNEYISMDYREMLAVLYGYFADVTAPAYLAELPAVNIDTEDETETAESEPEHLTPAEVLADYNKNQRAEDERKAAAKVAAAPAEVVADMYGDKTRAEVLAFLLNCDTDHAAALLADIENTTDPANVPDWTRYAYEIDEMKRRRCTFGQAVAKVGETRARILSRKTDKEREKWAQRAAAEVAPTNSKTDTRENGKAAAKVAAAALFLLSFTIGNSSPARIYTNTPADILAEVEAAGESVTAYTITQVTPNL